jgi:hypothetical protein
LAPAASAGLTQPSSMHRLLPVFPVFFFMSLRLCFGNW